MISLETVKKITDWQTSVAIIFCLHVLENHIISKQSYVKAHFLLKFQSILRPSHVDIDADKPITYDELQEWGQVKHFDEVESCGVFSVLWKTIF